MSLFMIIYFQKKTLTIVLFGLVCLPKGGKHPHRSVGQRYFGSGEEWHWKKWSVPHPSSGEDRPEEGSHPG